jgi:membrane protein YdbS with pleckstrin-like domain
MPAPLPDPSPARDEGTSAGAWALIWTLYVTKMVTVALVVWAAHSYDAAVLVAVTTWIWLGPLIALTAAPLLFRYRLHRVRARRSLLLQAEWRTGPATPAASPSPGAQRR